MSKFATLDTQIAGAESRSSGSKDIVTHIAKLIKVESRRPPWIKVTIWRIGVGDATYVLLGFLKTVRALTLFLYLNPGSLNYYRLA